jgi:hypothetical protein
LFQTIHLIVVFSMKVPCEFPLDDGDPVKNR